MSSSLGFFLSGLQALVYFLIFKMIKVPIASLWDKQNQD